MVYPGKRSTGCMRCRKRKVKCDEGRPTCERCKKYGRECPGYDNRLIIRFENQHRALKEDSNGGNTQNRSPDGSPSALNEAGLSPFTASPATTSGAMSTWSLEPPWEDVAIAYFFDQHVIEPKSGSLGHLEFLPALYLNSPTHSCLRPSLNAVANLSLYYSSKSPPLQFIARRLHHEALLSMNSALHDPGENCLDETLAAAMLLSLFEDIDGARPGVSNSHISGMVSLIQLRENTGPPADPNRSLYGWAYTQILFHSIIDGYIHLNPRWIPPCGIAEEDYLTQLCGLSPRMVRFCYAVRDTCATVNQPDRDTGSALAKAALLAILNDVIMIQSNLDALTHSVPGSLKPRQLDGVDGVDVRVYSSQWTACFWSIQYCSLVLFYTQVAICCKKLLTFDLSNDRSGKKMAHATLTMAESNVESLLRGISSNIPFALGEIDGDGNKQNVPEYKSGCGYLLIWPLSLLSRCDYSTAEQKLVADGALKTVASSMGIRLADWAAKRPHPFALF
ncbi:hypothetical protein B0J13DRAFT_565534 [Dactylonectria estremocensis]|uniref:Zn(2)-C6 fungal-type domain-containing protein n=1 Tax=Dactylonectria estremocensis TaxID=1079267 RepID=A0A9P9IPE9_9HYPO|nr:hypothetical protein B0J13DRAFT_565534 [Dactylonectria estremocensis]